MGSRGAYSKESIAARGYRFKTSGLAPLQPGAWRPTESRALNSGIKYTDFDVTLKGQKGRRLAQLRGKYYYGINGRERKSYIPDPTVRKYNTHPALAFEGMNTHRIMEKIDKRRVAKGKKRMTNLQRGRRLEDVESRIIHNYFH